MFTRLWRDEEIYGRIYMQACFLHSGEIVKPHSDPVLGDCLFGVMHKLTAMKHHMAQYEQIEAKGIVEFTLKFQTSVDTSKPAIHGRVKTGHFRVVTETGG